MFIRLLGIGLAAALLAVASPAMAATSAAQTILEEIETVPQVNDCLGSFDADAAILFVEADKGCDPVMADITGLCLVMAEPSLVLDVVAVLDPEQGVSCTSIRPSPPG